ncbi:unnamed protein product [Polarella glacialis]|uniref:Uncharacterized protein n=1 Tax=Polarella glacialis TaxID=89957 RepID=A0A813JTG9_POLGL|nr:unnamed protein product [Polarella glacialis]
MSDWGTQDPCAAREQLRQITRQDELEADEDTVEVLAERLGQAFRRAGEVTWGRQAQPHQRLSEDAEKEDSIELFPSCIEVQRMLPDCVKRSDPSKVPPGCFSVLHGDNTQKETQAMAAEETRAQKVQAARARGEAAMLRLQIEETRRLQTLEMQTLVHKPCRAEEVQCKKPLNTSNGLTLRFSRVGGS